MDARLTEEQELLRSTAEQVARELGPASPDALDPRELAESGWRQLAELGVLGIRVPESAGGFPMSGVEAALAGEMWTLGLGPGERVGAAHVVLPSLEGVHWPDILALLADAQKGQA